MDPRPIPERERVAFLAARDAGPAASAPSIDGRPRVALVTGACSGIGRAIAERLAARGLDLAVASDRPARLSEAARALRDRFGVAVHEIAIDLSKPGSDAELLARVAELGADVEILVSNAGFLLFGEAVDAEPERARALLELQVVTPSLLCTRLGREMRARGRGHILLVSSISAFRHFPGIAYYGASKRYLRGFAGALRSELAPQGVSFTCLLPGPVDTDLYPAGAAPVARARRLGLLATPEAVAEAGVRAMLAGRAECVPGLHARLLAWAAAATPQWAVDLLLRRGPWLRPGERR